jgi:AcrR family transcriptional regulator
LFVTILSRFLPADDFDLYCAVSMKVAMRVTVHKRKRNRTARERALLLAASKLFASRGYDATTTREIAARAGCAEGLIHRYFASKAGLLLAIIKCEVSQEVLDLNARLPLAPSIGAEIVQLVNWEVERMWRDREFLRVVIPRALLDPAVGQVFTRVGPLQRTKAIDERLRKFKECESLPDHEIDALAHFVSVLGFAFGFVRPMVLRQERNRARKMAATIANIVARYFESAEPSDSGQGRSLKTIPLFT